MSPTEQNPSVESILKAIRNLPEKDLLYLCTDGSKAQRKFATSHAKRVTYGMLPARPAVPLLAVAGKNQSLERTWPMMKKKFRQLMSGRRHHTRPLSKASKEWRVMKADELKTTIREVRTKEDYVIPTHDLYEIRLNAL